jgi:hypothetical protein
MLVGSLYPVFLVCASPWGHSGLRIQFFGVVLVGQMCVVPLTSLLSIVDTAGEEFQWDLFLAFKAASIVLAEIQTHVLEIVQVLKRPDVDWPPVIPVMVVCFPSITEIETKTTTFPSTKLQPIKFILESWYDNVEH